MSVQDYFIFCIFDINQVGTAMTEWIGSLTLNNLSLRSMGSILFMDSGFCPGIELYWFYTGHFVYLKYRMEGKNWKSHDLALRTLTMSVQQN